MLEGGHGVHWPELDEDISIENILLGQPSGEGARSFSRRLEWYRSEPPFDQRNEMSATPKYQRQPGLPIQA